MPPHTSENFKCRIAVFITPHGFGHAARAAAVMAALHERNPALQFEIFTRVPQTFFQDSLSGPFVYHEVLTDIGLVQKTPLHADLSETLKRLDGFFPFDRSRIAELARQMDRLECELVICDIAPLGIAVAREAGIPSLLIENFTWDWIYRGYVATEPGMERHAAYLQELFDAADTHIQTEPACLDRPGHLTTEPVCRKIRSPIDRIRDRLGVLARARVVMVTLGGTPHRYELPTQLADHRDVTFLVPTDGAALQVRDNLILLPRHPDLFHPDLVNASDLVIGKLGYSTVAEVYQAGVPFGYIARPNFRESAVLAAYAESRMQGIAIAETEFHDGTWMDRLPDLLALPRLQRRGRNGADRIADFILKRCA